MSRSRCMIPGSWFLDASENLNRSQGFPLDETKRPSRLIFHLPRPVIAARIKSLLALLSPKEVSRTVTDKLFLSLLHCRWAAAETLTDRRDTLGIYNYQPLSPPSLDKPPASNSQSLLLFLRLFLCASTVSTCATRSAGCCCNAPLIGDDCSVTSSGGREETNRGRESKRERGDAWLIGPFKCLWTGTVRESEVRW